jgi:hypothetical protein
MSRTRTKSQLFLEIALLLVCLALACLLYRVNGYKMIVLNLFYLPVVLAGFFLGRYGAGVLVVFCVIGATVATALDLSNFAAFSSPLTIGLALTTWGAVLGLNAIIVGTLSDEKTQKIGELQDAYVGVVEVLSRYLSSADPNRKSRATLACDLSQRVARRMKLSTKEVDDIRVAALLQDVENIEITAKVIQRAAGDLSLGARLTAPEHKFQGKDLVQSLASVMTGAIPLLVDQGDSFIPDTTDEEGLEPRSVPLGANIIHTVREYLTLLERTPSPALPGKVIRIMKNDVNGEHHPAVLHALEQELQCESNSTRGVAANETPAECVALGV